MISNNKLNIQKKFKIDKNVRVNNEKEYLTKDFSIEFHSDEEQLEQINKLTITSHEKKINKVKNIIDNSIIYGKIINKQLPTEALIHKASSINIILYNLVTSEVNPFVLFLLYKNDNNTLEFPTINKNELPKNKTAQEYIHKLEKAYEKIFEKSKSKDESNDDIDNIINIDYSGYLLKDSELYLFLAYNNDENKIELEHNKYKSRYWWTLSSELVNYKKVLSFDVDDNVTQFFLNNSTLLYVYDNTLNPYESPVVGYYGGYYKQISTVVALGLKREKPYASFGPFYYFGDYKQAMRYAIWSSLKKPMEVNGKLITKDEEGKYEKGGLVRFVLFTGKMKIMMGRPEDPDDDSDISIKGQKDNEFIKATLKFRDNNGKWIKEYNSIGYGKQNIYLKSKHKEITLNPMIALKDYEQQIPLGYYYVNTDQDVSIDNSEDAIIE